jgi:hypothetical protein
MLFSDSPFMAPKGYPDGEKVSRATIFKAGGWKAPGTIFDLPGTVLRFNSCHRLQGNITFPSDAANR